MFDRKPTKLSIDERASLKRYVINLKPPFSPDWQSIEAYYSCVGRECGGLVVSIRTTPIVSKEGICRSEQHEFYLEAPTGAWHKAEEWNTLLAWPARGTDCANASSRIIVDKSITDSEFLTLEREQQALLNSAKRLIAWSTCHDFLHRAAALHEIRRLREGTPPRLVLSLPYFPSDASTNHGNGMTVSFRGEVGDLLPWNISCAWP